MIEFFKERSKTTKLYNKVCDDANSQETHYRYMKQRILKKHTTATRFELSRNELRENYIESSATLIIKDAKRMPYTYLGIR